PLTTPAAPTLPAWATVTLFTLTTVAFFWPNLTGSRFFWEDFVEQFYPNQVFAARHWARGVIPFWNPYTFCGMPFLADPQVAFFYLPHSLLGLVQLATETLPFWAVQTLVILHFIAAQWGMFQLGRAFGASTTAALLAGVGYGFSGILTHHVIHPMIVYHLTWLPWVLLLLKRAVEEARWKWTLIGGLILGMSLHGGHPQTVLYEYLLLSGFAVWLLGMRVWKHGWGPARLAEAVRSFVPLSLAAALFIVQFLPTQELAAHSERTAGQKLEWAAEVSLHPSQLLTLVVPRLFGSTEPSGVQHVPYYLPDARYYHYWETAFYVGIPVLLLAILGMIRRWRTPFGLFWLLVALFSALFALGKHGFLFPLLYQLPGFSLFRVPPRLLFFLTLALCAFAAWGFDELWQHQRQRQPLRQLLWGSLPIAAVAFTVSAGLLPTIVGAPERFVPMLQSEGTVALAITVLTVLVAVSLWQGWIPPLAAGLSLGVVLLSDLIHAHASFTRSPTRPEQFYSLSPVLKQMLQPRPPDTLFRVSMRADFGMAMLRNQGLLDSIMLYEGYNQLRLQRRNPPMPTADATFDLLNIRYQIALDTSTQRMYFRERPSALPRAWMVYRARVAPSDSTEAILRRGELQPRLEALVEADPGLPLPGTVPDSVRHTLRCRVYEHNWQHWEVETAHPGLLCFSEIWYPAWKAFVNGTEVPVLRAYHSLRAIPIPAGSHTVELRYDSSSFRTGAWISALTLALTLVALLLCDRRRPTT
ncbi:MAG: hypothetical protein RMK93_07730, partial [Bacteroidota bacterium]|nr:hypothetical protein [Bacteroidota bacterium]